MKRLLDLFFSLFGIIIFFPLIIILMFFTWLYDFGNPLYISKRVGKNFDEFNFIKLRSMVLNADKSGVDSTGSDDARITRLGHFMRRYKFDEIIQLFNVLVGV